MFSLVICLGIMFLKWCQHCRIFRYKAHLRFLVLASTSVYSFYVGKKLSIKPDAYGIISSAAFATASLCISKKIECFLDLCYFFCEVLITQLMEIKPLFGIAGLCFTCLLVNLPSYLPNEPGSTSGGDHPLEAVRVEQPSGPRSSYASSDTDIIPTSNNQNQQAIIPSDYLFSASLQSRSSRALRRRRHKSSASPVPGKSTRDSSPPYQKQNKKKKTEAEGSRRVESIADGSWMGTNSIFKSLVYLVLGLDNCRIFQQLSLIAELPSLGEIEILCKEHVQNAYSDECYDVWRVEFSSYFEGLTIAGQPNME